MDTCRFSSIRELLLFSLVFIASCGGGGDEGGDSASQQPPPPPPPTNRAPTVDAGSPQSAQGGGLVILKGSATDPDGNPLTYLWTQTAGPPVVLQNASSALASFTAPIAAGVVSFDFELRVTDTGNMPASDTTNVLVSSGFRPCVLTTPPASLGLSTFYTDHCDANGIGIVAESKVSDRALEWARFQVLEKVKLRPDVLQAMVGRNSYVVVLAKGVCINDLPDVRDDFVATLGSPWTCETLRGHNFGNFTVVSEENLLCEQNDPYMGYSILVHEFAHSIDLAGLRITDSTWTARLKATYEAAMASGLWPNRHSATNKEEYWAEGVGIFLNAYWPRPSSPNPTPYTRAELATYDPALFGLLREVFPETDLPRCPP